MIQEEFARRIVARKRKCTLAAVSADIYHENEQFAAFQDRTSLQRSGVMTLQELESCPRCGGALEAGFAHKSNGLSFVTPQKLDQFISVDEDLAQAGWRKFVPCRVEYFRSQVCRNCELYLIDYGTALSHAQAKELALTLVGTK